MAESTRWYMDLAGEVFAGIGANTNDALGAFVEENGLSDGIDLNLDQIAYGFRPEPIRPEFLIKRTPYANPEPLVSQMDGAVERGWLEALGRERYTLSARGEEVTAGLFELADDIFGEVQSLPELG